MNISDFERLLNRQKLNFKKLLTQNASELEKKSDQLNRDELTLAKIDRSIEFSNISLGVSENAYLSHIPKVGEEVKHNKVTNVRYRIDGGICSVDLTLETEIKVYQHLSFGEAQVYESINTSYVVGRSKKSDDEQQQTIFYRSSLNNTVISEEQFDQWFPIIQQKVEQAQVNAKKPSKLKRILQGLLS